MSTGAKRDYQSVDPVGSSPDSRKRIRPGHMSDVYSDSEHTRLDEKLKKWRSIIVNIDDVESAGLILAWIATDCEGIDPQYSSPTASKILLKNNPEVYEALKIAHASGSYKEVRNLDILQKRGLFTTQGAYYVMPPYPSRKLAVSLSSSKTATERSWERPYIGDGALTLYEALVFYNTTATKLYSRAIPLLQSSGTGKSRTLDELAKTVFVIPINLRGHTGGYPAADSALRDWLFLDLGGNVGARRANAFLTALFVQTKSVVDQIDELLPNKRIFTLASKFRHFMTAGQQFDTQGPFRVQFYNEVMDLADQILSEMVPSTGNEKGKMREITLVQAATELMEKIREADEPQEPGDPFLVLSFDEVHAIATDPMTAIDDNWGWPKFSELRRAIREVVSLPIFVIFLSTTGKIHHFLPARPNDSSNPGCIQRGTLSSIRPFHEVGFDQLAEKVAGDGSWTLDMVTETKFIAKLGRPLFGSRFESGDEAVKKYIVAFAAEKLLRSPYPTEDDDISQEGMLACLCVRLALEFNATTYQGRRKEQVQVEKHMRICSTAGPGFDETVTVAASEPILAEASANLMRHKSFNVPQVLLDELRFSGLSKGDRGELIAMTILLLARDQARPGLRTLPLLSFMLALFPVNLGNIVQAAMPSFINAESRDKPLKETFSESHIWFNHFIKVHCYDILNREYLWRLIVRGAAVLCATCQRGVDIVIPFLYNDKRLMKTNVSAILIQVKNDANFSNSPHQSLFDAMDPFMLGVFDSGEAPVPVIRMVFALAAVHPEVQVISAGDRTQPAQAAEQRPQMAAYTAYDFWCCRASSKTFAPIREQDEYVYKELVEISCGLPTYKERDRPLARATRRRMHPGTGLAASRWSQFIEDP